MTRAPFLGWCLLAAACAAPGPRLEDPAAVLTVVPGALRVLVFVTTDCPIANSYAPWLAAFGRELRGSEVQLTLVHVDPDLDVAAAGQHARDYGLDLPIVLDGDQRVARAVGATVTPSAAVLSARGLEYLGRIDDRWQARGVDGQTAAHDDLREAVRALRQGSPVAVPRTTAVGCRLPTPRG